MSESVLTSEEISDELSRWCYQIEKVTHQKVDDDFPVSKFLEIQKHIQEDPSFKQK